MAAFGDTFSVYPWNATSSAAQTTIQWTTAGSTAQYYPQTYYPPAPLVEMPEGPMEWLKRRVTEITDLAYAA